MLRWILACLLAAVYTGAVYELIIDLRPPPPEQSIIGSVIAALVLLAVPLGIGGVAALTLGLHNRSLRDRIVGSIVLSLAASLGALIVLYGIFRGQNTLAGAGTHMLAELPLRWLVMMVFAFAGVSAFRGIANLKQRKQSGKPPTPPTP